MPKVHYAELVETDEWGDPVYSPLTACEIKTWDEIANADFLSADIEEIECFKCVVVLLKSLTERLDRFEKKGGLLA